MSLFYPKKLYGRPHREEAVPKSVHLPASYLFIHLEDISLMIYYVPGTKVHLWIRETD